MQKLFKYPRIGAAVILAVLVLLAVSFMSNPTSAQRRDNGTNNFFANTLDSGTHPCMGSRLYFIIDFGPNAGKILRPFIPVEIDERMRASGYALCTAEDLKGSKWEGTNPPIIYLESIGKSERGGWLWPKKDHCITGDVTPPENGGEVIPGDFPPE